MRVKQYLLDIEEEYVAHGDSANPEHYINMKNDFIQPTAFRYI